MMRCLIASTSLDYVWVMIVEPIAPTQKMRDRLRSHHCQIST
ncbi:hypothetical protein [Microcoleus sp.]